MLNFIDHTDKLIILNTKNWLIIASPIIQVIDSLFFYSAGFVIWLFAEIAKQKFAFGTEKLK
jgi:hypothetical protein